MDFITEQTLLPGYILASFDVVSLFTRVPVDLAIGVAQRRLEADSTLDERTCLSVNNIIQLLKLCLQATYFCFKGNVYQQVFGTAMGSPVSVVVANLVMEDVEERALATFSDPPQFWKRYVDDICVAINRNKIQDFLYHLNTIEESIQFTVEVESDTNGLPFLDVYLHRYENGSVGTSVYRKPTHTDNYLDFRSHHPIQHRTGVVYTLLKRAKVLSSTAVDEALEVKRLVSVLKQNHYPRSVMNRCDIRRKHKTSEKDSVKKGDLIVVLPYIQGTSEE